MLKENHPLLQTGNNIYLPLPHIPPSTSHLIDTLISLLKGLQQVCRILFSSTFVVHLEYNSTLYTRDKFLPELSISSLYQTYTCHIWKCLQFLQINKTARPEYPFHNVQTMHCKLLTPLYENQSQFLVKQYNLYCSQGEESLNLINS